MVSLQGYEETFAGKEMGVKVTSKSGIVLLMVLL